MPTSSPADSSKTPRTLDEIRATGAAWITDAELAWLCDQAATADPANPRDRLWVNDDRTVLARLWTDGTVEVATRPTTDHVWGPPAYLTEEKR